MKSNLEYYNHRKDSHRHPKFKLLRALHGGGERGWAAEGRFWALNNIISDSENCELDLTKNRNKAVVAEELNISLDELNNFIQTLLSDDIELILEAEPGIYTTKKVKEAFGKVSDEREKARIRKEKVKKSNSSGEPAESSGEPNNRVNEIKGNEIKSKENTELPIYSLPSTFDLPLPTITNYETFIPDDFNDDLQLRAQIEKLLKHFTHNPDNKTITTFYNVVAKKNKLTEKVSKQTSFKILYEICSNWNNLESGKKNYGYLFKKFTGMIEDKLIEARERKNNAEKTVEKEETSKIADVEILETLNKISSSMVLK